MHSLRGATLMEIVLVSLIGGVLAMGVLPAYLRTAEAGRRSQAEYILHLIRGAQQKYHATHGTFTTNWADLEIDNLSLNNGHFAYQLAAANDDNFIASAIRQGAGYEVRIDSKGLVDEVTTASTPAYLPPSTDQGGIPGDTPDSSASDIPPSIQGDPDFRFSIATDEAAPISQLNN